MTDEKSLLKAFQETRSIATLSHYASIVRSHMIISRYMETKNTTPELKERFQSWLFFGSNCEEKDIALELWFHKNIGPDYTGNITDKLPLITEGEDIYDDQEE